MTQYKNIIFDLGGVILNIDYDLTEQAFREIGGDKFGIIYSQFKQQNFFDDFETGKLSAAGFREAIRQRLEVNISDELIDTAWNAMLLDLPEKRLKLLDRLQEKYHTVLLSNTNPIHYKAFHKIIKNAHGITSLEPYFQKVYYSNHIGLRKPNPAIFKLILEENAFRPAETLFIDDSPQHVKGAEGLGLKTFHLTKTKSLEQALEELNIQPGA